MKTIEMRKIRKAIQELSQALTGNKYTYLVNYDKPNTVRIEKWIELERNKELTITMIASKNDVKLNRTTRWYFDVYMGSLAGKMEDRQESEPMDKADLDKIDTAILEKAQAYL